MDIFDCILSTFVEVLPSDKPIFLNGLETLPYYSAPSGISPQAAQIIGKGKIDHPTTFLRRNSKWHRHLQAQDAGDHKLWEVAVLFHMRDAFRSGDIWLPHSRRYGDLKQALVPLAAVQNTPCLSVPFEPMAWLEDRKARMADGLNRLAKAARHGAIPGGSIENGTLKLDRLSAHVPAEADQLVLDLYRRLPDVRITDMLLAVELLSHISPLGWAHILLTGEYRWPKS